MPSSLPVIRQPGDPAVEEVLALLVELAAQRVEPLDDPLGDAGVVAEPDRAGDHQDVAAEDPRVEVGPVVGLPAVLAHVGVDAGRDVVVDRADHVDLDAVLAHDRGAGVDQALGVAGLGAPLEGAVDERRLEAGEVRSRSCPRLTTCARRARGKRHLGAPRIQATSRGPRCSAPQPLGGRWAGRARGSAAGARRGRCRTGRRAPPGRRGTRAVRRSGPATASRNATISSWVRPTKFHHITIGSPNGGAAEEQQPGSSSAVSSTVRSRRAGRRRGRRCLTSAPSTATTPGVDEDAVLERRRRRRASSVAPAGACISAPSSGVCVATGEVDPSSEPRKTRASQPSPATGSGAWCAKPGRRGGWRRAAPPRAGRRAARSSRRGDLGVADAAAGCHQVDLAGAHHRVVAGAVAVLDLAGEEPAHRLQAGVRVRRHAHAAGVGDVVGAVVVEEAPGADQGALRCGSVRRTYIARGPPSGTSRGTSSSTPAGASPSPHTTSPGRPPGCSCPQSAPPRTDSP